MSFSCKVCGEVFKTNVLLIRHRRYQSRKCEQYKIHSCCLSGSLISYLSTNSTIKVVECSRCGKTFFNPKHLSIHMRIHTKSTPYKCDFCSKTFILMLHLYYHLNSHQEEDINENKCMKCQSKLQELLRKLNLDGSTISTLSCLFCNKKRFSNVTQLILHLRTHRLRLSVCSDCGFMSISFQDVVSYLERQSSLIQIKDQHYRPADTNGNKKIQCKSCGRTFQKVRLLEIHLLSHISDPLFCCRNCQEVFRNGQLYVMHIKKCLRKKMLPSSDEFIADHFSVMSDEAFDCPYCKLSFSSPSQLQTHLPFHSDVKDSRSDTESADEDFILKDQGKTKMNSSPSHVHAFVCPNCKQVFRKNRDLDVHMKTDCLHKYNCKQCFKIFSQWSDLEKHIKNHHCIDYQADSLDQRLTLMLTPAQHSECKVKHNSSKLLNRDSQCYKSFVSNASVGSHKILHLSAGALPSSGKDINRISSNNCPPGYFDSENGHERHEKEMDEGDNSKSQSEHYLCDVCGEVFSVLVDLDDHMKMHNCQEVCEPIYTMANMNHSRQPDVYPSQPPWMVFRPSGNLSMPYFVPNSRVENIFSSGPDMNSNFGRTENMNLSSQRSGFSLVQTNNVTVPTFSSPTNGIPFIPSVNELKNIPYSELVPPAFPFHLQNNRANFFPVPNLDNRSSVSSLPYEDCRDNNLTFNDNSKFNAFYSVPSQGNVSLANNNGKNSNFERNISGSPIISEKRNTFFSQLTLVTQNNGNLETVPQKTNSDRISHSTSEYQLNTSFIPERGNCVSNISQKNSTGLDNNRASFPVSFSESKCSNFMSKNQNNLTENNPPFSMKTNTNNVENQNVEYPAVNELLITLPNLSQGQNLTEMEPLNLCQTRNLQTGKFYNYSVDPDSKGFYPQQPPINNLPTNIQAPYSVPPFWEESKSYFGMNFDGGNPCPTSENESAIKFNPGLQIENMQPSLWVEPKPYYNMNLNPFRDLTSGQADDKIVKMKTNKSSYPAFLEDHGGHIDSLYVSQNNSTGNELLKPGNHNMEYVPFLQLKPNLSNSVNNTGDNDGNSSKDDICGVNNLQNPALGTERENMVLP